MKCLALLRLILLLLPMALAQVPEPKELADSSSELVFANRLKTIGGDRATDCGATASSKPDNSVAACGLNAFQDHKPFVLAYFTRYGANLGFAYGLASDRSGNVFAVSYQTRAFPPVAPNRHTRLMDENHTRVAECIKPIKLDKTQQGLLACITPVNQQKSDEVAHQKPIDTMLCDVLKDPASFNNKLVRIRGRYSGNFEYSELSDDGCTGSLWFGYAGGGSPPSLAAYVSGGVSIGSEDAEGKLILPIPLTLVRDLKFERFEKAVGAVSSNHKVVPLEGGVTEPRFVTATFVGRIDAVTKEVHEFLKKQPPGQGPVGLGFGQMNQFEAQFILQSVEDDARLE